MRKSMMLLLLMMVSLMVATDAYRVDVFNQKGYGSPNSGKDSKLNQCIWIEKNTAGQVSSVKISADVKDRNKVVKFFSDAKCGSSSFLWASQTSGDVPSAHDKKFRSWRIVEMPHPGGGK
nr:PREDICTED: uncharacterized protein LOC109039036 [Bemisia tabaci]